MQAKNDQMIIRDSKQSYESLKLTYFELKNQNEIANLKYLEQNEDAFVHKKEILKLERENKIQKDSIERLRREIIENKERYLIDSSIKDFKEAKEFKPNIKNENILHSNSINFNPKHKTIQELESQYLAKKAVNTDSEEDNFDRHIGNKVKLEKVEKIKESYDKVNEKDISKANKIINLSNKSLEDFSEVQIYKQINKRKNMKPDHVKTDLSMLPSQKHLQERESKVVEVEIKLCDVQKEKDRVNFDLNKFRYILS